VAGSARLAALHLLHADSGFAPLRRIDRCVAVAAGIHAAVQFVAERRIAGIFNLKGEFLCGVTGRAGFESCSVLAVMAGSARSAFLHFRHTDRFGAAGRGVQFGVAVAALVCLKMFGMAEQCRSGLLDLECYVLDRVASGAVLDRESFFTIMARSTRLAFVHVCHAYRFCLFFGGIQLSVAVFTAVGCDMLGVAEQCRPGFLDFEGDILYRVAGGAGINAECFFAIMACPAGFALFHVGHACPLVFTSCEKGRMTGGAIGTEGYVGLVAEMCRTRSLDLIDDFPGLVAAGAIFKPECFLGVMAGAAGSALVHVGHGVTCFLFYAEDCVMTCLAIASHVFLGHVDFVAELYLAGGFGLKGDIADINGQSRAAGHYQE